MTSDPEVLGNVCHFTAVNFASLISFSGRCLEGIVDDFVPFVNGGSGGEGAVADVENFMRDTGLSKMNSRV